MLFKDLSNRTKSRITKSVHHQILNDNSGRVTSFWLETIDGSMLAIFVVVAILRLSASWVQFRPP